MKSEVFSDFRLVGGTALALQIGHRNSVDIDLFGNCTINEELFSSELQKFGDVEIQTSSSKIMICNVNGVKIDFVNHNYPFLFDPIYDDEMRMARKEDITPMKLNAIEGRGSRKDFVDLFFLLREFSLPEMIELYHKKYPHHTDFMMLQSVCYFNDAENMPMPKMFVDFDWEECKKTIVAEHKKLRI